MKLHQLQALVRVVEHGSIRAAARASHVTQAAFTKSLRQLEDDTGIPLLVRQSKGVTLTEAGRRLHARAQLVTRQIELARDDIRHTLGQEDGVVRAGLTPFLMLTVLGEAFRWFRKRYPRVELRVMEGLVTRVLPSLRDGSLDFAIVADTGDVSKQEFNTRMLKVLPQVLVVRAGHPILKTPIAKKLCELEWVLPGPLVQGLDDGIATMFKKAGLKPPDQITRCDALAAMSLVRQSDSVCVMPTPLLGQPESHGLVSVPIRALLPPPVSLVLLTRTEVPPTPAADYFARCLMDAVCVD
jgi:DNA-binding transcriptional LysR family regulator